MLRATPEKDVSACQSARTGHAECERIQTNGLIAGEALREAIDVKELCGFSLEHGHPTVFDFALKRGQVRDASKRSETVLFVVELNAIDRSNPSS